jgi:hypothetical protein
MKRNEIAGRWRLVSYEASGPQGIVHPMGAKAVGVLDYSTDGKVSVHIMGEGYFAYYGDYAVDEQASTVTHKLEMASEPSFVGASNLRHAELRGATLVLSGAMQIDGQPHAIRVTWKR